MTWSNYDEVISQLEAAGLLISGASGCGIQADTLSPVRCRVQGQRGKPGWYKLFTLTTRDSSAILVGAYGVYQGNDPGTIKIAISRGERERLTADQLSALRARQEADRRTAALQLAARHERAARQASLWWRKLQVFGDSAYLHRKGLPAGRLYGARISPSGNLVIPMQDYSGKIWGLQVIYSDPAIKARKGRDKDFTPPGLAKAGRFFLIGGLQINGVALICEGFATGASLHEATGIPVVVAFDAGNLLPVARELARRYRGLRLLFCADDDYDWQRSGKVNTGIDAARTAALAVNGQVCIPQFPGDRPELTHKGPTDFNDLHCHPDGGLHVVRAQIEASLSAAGWSFRPLQAVRADVLEEGGGARPSLRSNITIEEATQRWALIYGAKDALFDFDEHRLVCKSNVLDLLPDHAWRDWKRAGMQVYRIEEVGFDPTGKDESVKCNLWAGWPTKPREGNCENLLDLLRYLCSKEADPEAVFDWVLRWIAYPLQNPGAKMRTALVFHGEPGAGKNLIFETLMAIYGEYGAVIDQSAIEDKFNDYASRKLFLVADEVVARSDLWHVKNKLKGFITGQWIRINPKQVAAHNERNHVNMVFLSNEDQPTVIERGDRRYTVVHTPDALSADYYDRCRKELEAGGREALHHYLLNLPLGDFHEHSKPPLTDAKLHVQQLSASSIERFWCEWIEGETAHPVCPCASGQLYIAYSRWCQRNGERPRAQNHLSGFAIHRSGWSIALKYRFQRLTYSGPLIKGRIVMPPEDLLWAKTVDADDYRKPADRTETQWITDCWFAFQDSLNADPGGSDRSFD